MSVSVCRCTECVCVSVSVGVLSVYTLFDGDTNHSGHLDEWGKMAWTAFIYIIACNVPLEC